MDVVLLPINPISLIAIAIMTVTLAITLWRKMMITYGLIIANFLVFLITLFFQNEIIGDLGFRPIYLSAEYLPQIYTIFTSMFVHSDFLHILGNMFVFFFMGVAFEQRIGRKTFLIIYLITGVCGALTHATLNLNSPVLLVGASGAIFGILGAFAYSYPRDEVVMPVPIGIMIIMRIKVIYATILFAALETAIVVLSVQDNTAHFAHLGGLVSGVVLAAILVGKQGHKMKHTTATGTYTHTESSTSQKIDLSSLRQLATTPELSDMLQRIDGETVVQVKDVWLEHFLEKAVCPVCQKPVNHFRRQVWCEDEHFRISY